MKKLIFILLFIPLVTCGQKVKGEKIFSIKASIGEACVEFMTFPLGS